MERELSDAVAVLNTIADPREELHQDGRSIDRTYEDIALECLTRIRGSNPKLTLDAPGSSVRSEEAP